MKKNIVYLDYSATTKPDKRVLAYLNNLAQNSFANPNANHSLGFEAKKIIDNALQSIAGYLGIQPSEIIFTSGASEANNLAIKGITEGSRGRQIITTQLEHSSIFGPLGYLQKLGYKIDFVKLNNDGTVDIEHLKTLITDDTLLVSIGAVDSELGTRQPIEEIGQILKNYPAVIFHSDITQCLGKAKIDLANVDLASFSGHKIYCFKGIGGLIKKESIKLTPLIHGGKSTTIFRSGTPPTELIGALAESFNLFNITLDEKYNYVTGLNQYLRTELSKYKAIVINSSNQAIPHILNFSIMGKKADDTQQYFAKENIFLSTKTACASNDDLSKSVLAVTQDKDRAASSIRVSLSYKTTEQEIKQFMVILQQYLEEQI